MKIGMTAKVTKNDFGRLANGLRDRANQVVRKATFDIEAGAKQRVPVDTGALKNSIQGGMESDLVGVVSVGQEYAAAVEFGTSRAGAQPYLTPSLDAARGPFQAALRELFR